MKQSTLFIAQIAAPYLIVTGTGFLLSKSFYLRMLNEADTEHPISLNLSGMVHFLIGMAILLTHFLWSNHLEIAVSLIGVATLAKGLVLILLPGLSLKSNQISVRMLPLIGAGFITAGLYLGWASYFLYG